MDKNKFIHLSKLLGYILRHKPAQYNLTLDSQSQVDINRLLANLQQQGHTISREQLNNIIK